MLPLLQLALVLCVVQILNYGLLVVNYRAVAQGHVRVMVISDGLCATFSFFVIKNIAQHSDSSVIPWLGYAIGGMLGSVFGLWVSRRLHKDKKEA